MRRVFTAALLSFAGGAAWADFDAGVRHLRRGDLEYAYREFKESAEQGHVLSARALGQMLERGTEFQGGQKVEARPEEAARWYRQAAEGGDKISAELLAGMYASARGVAFDSGESMRWFAKAGRNPTAETVEQVRHLAPEDRQDALAWGNALGVALARDTHYPREARREGADGDVCVMFDTERGSVEVLPESAGVSELLRDPTLAAAKAAFALIPPPPAVTRNKFRFKNCVLYRIR